MDVRVNDMIDLALRQSIGRNADRILQALDIDGSRMDGGEKLCAILKACLFDKAPLPNPMEAFVKRCRKGDFDCLHDGEDPDLAYDGPLCWYDLPEGRAAMSNGDYEVLYRNVEELSVCWGGKPAARAFEIAAQVALLSCVDADALLSAMAAAD